MDVQINNINLYLKQIISTVKFTTIKKRMCHVFNTPELLSGTCAGSFSKVRNTDKSKYNEFAKYIGNIKKFMFPIYFVYSLYLDFSVFWIQ